MGFQPCILAILGTAATEHGMESRSASDQERLVCRLTFVIRILADPAVALRHLPPFVVRRQSPSISQCLTSPLRRLPRVQTAIPAAIPFGIFVAVGRDGPDVEIVRRPLFAVGHPNGGMHRAGRCPVLREPERHAERDGCGQHTNRPGPVRSASHERHPPRAEPLYMRRLRPVTRIKWKDYSA